MGGVITTTTIGMLETEIIFIFVGNVINMKGYGYEINK